MFENVTYLNRQSRHTVYALLATVIVLGTLFFVGGRRFLNGEDLMPDTIDENFYEKDYPAGYAAGKGRKTKDGIPVSEKTEDEYESPDARCAELFPFDPNTADVSTLTRLGLSRYLIRNICRYRSKGGTFRCVEDFAQLYGLTLGQYKRLAPYIRISNDFRPASEFISRSGYSSARSYPAASQPHTYPANRTAQDSMAHPAKIHEGEYIQLNVSDTTQLCMVPGIGKGFARRIYKYRQRLGGFTSVSQLLEIQDMPESAIRYFRVDGGKIRKLRINRSTSEQLRSHPYIDFRQARDILDYRRLRGDIRNINDLRAVHAFTENDLRKLLPYIDFN